MTKRGSMTNKQLFLGVALTLIAVLSATLLHAQPAASHQLEGSWVGDSAPGEAPTLVTFAKEGAVIATRPITVLTNTGAELVSTGHGEWTETRGGGFTSTVLYLRSSLMAEFTGLVKVRSTIKLNN